MSLRFASEIRVFVYSQAIDMRSGFGKLAALVSGEMKRNLFEGDLFLFLGTVWTMIH